MTSEKRRTSRCTGANYAGNVIFFLFNVAEAISDPCVLLLIYHLCERSVLQERRAVATPSVLSSGVLLTHNLTFDYPGLTSAVPGPTTDDPVLTSTDPSLTSAMTTFSDVLLTHNLTSAVPGLTSADPVLTSPDPGLTSSDPGLTSADPGLVEAVQMKTAGYLMLYRLLLNVPSVVVALVTGPLSDLWGPLLPALVSSAGSVLACVCYCAGALMEEGSLPPGEALVVLYCGAAVRALAGRYAGMSMSLHSQTAGVSTVSARTARVGALLAAGLFGSGLGGLVVAGGLYTVSYSGVFLVAMLLYAACLLPTALIYRSSSPPGGVHHSSTPSQPGGVDHSSDSSQPGGASHTHPPSQPGDSCHSCRQYTCLSCAEQSHLPALLLPLATVALLRGCRAGHEDILLLWVTCPPFSWDKPLYGLLMAVDFCGLGIAALLLSLTLRGHNKVKDVSLVTYGLLARALSCVTLALTTETWAVFAGALLGAPASVANAALKADISKRVPAGDLGKTFAVVACVETVSNLLGSVLFALLYKHTYTWGRETLFVIEFILHLIFFVIYYIARCCDRAKGKCGHSHVDVKVRCDKEYRLLTRDDATESSDDNGDDHAHD